MKPFNLLLFGLFGVALLLRIPLALQEGLWADEIFSLAMATGHSLEHPAAEADPKRGDFIEPKGAQSASSFREYLQHETPPAGVQRVIRAVSLSDTSPPLYYLILNLWTRIAGTSDASLRSLSTFFALACFPLFWYVGRAIGGKPMAWSACVLFTFSPIALYYAGEGRMYSLLWFLGLLLAWLTLQLHRRGSSLSLMFMWCLVSTGGLLTHYFFAFVCVAFSFWLWLHPGKLPRSSLMGMCILVGLLIMPWYLQIPESLSRWRVTGGWLNYPLTWKQVLTAPLLLPYGLLSGKGIWGGLRVAGWFAVGVFTVLLVLALRKRRWRLFMGHGQVLWLWGLAAIGGPILFDLVLMTKSSTILRYVLHRSTGGSVIGRALHRASPRKGSKGPPSLDPSCLAPRNWGALSGAFTSMGTVSGSSCATHVLGPTF